MAILRMLWWVAIFFVCQDTRGQEISSFENLSIDRPDISNLPVTVRPGHYQFEIGVEFDKNRDAEEFYLPSFLLRTGIGKKTELRIGSSVGRIDSIREDLLDYITSGSLSIKHRILEEKGWRPSVAIQPEVNFSYVRNNGDIRKEMTYDLLFLFNNTFHEQVFLNYNAGIYWIGRREKRFLLSASLSFLHTHRLGYFLEAFTLRTWEERNNFSFDGGLTYLIRPRFQIDLYVGKRWANNFSYRFVGSGIGFRLDRGDWKAKTFKEIGIHH